MSQARVFELNQKKNKLIADATQALDGGDEVQYRSIRANIDTLQQDIDALRQIEGLLNRSKPVAEVQSPTVPTPVVILSPEQRKEQAYRNYFTKGIQTRDLTTASDGSGEAMVQEDWEPQWTAALKQYGPLASLVRMIVKTDGAPTRIPYADGTAQVMHYLADAGSITALEADPSLHSNVPGTDTLVSFTRASVQLYRDAQIEGGLEGFIKNNIFKIAARGLETALLSGVDGIGTALPSNPGFLSSVPQGAVTTSANAVTYAEVKALYDSVDASYRNAPNSGFYASQTTHDAIAGILDSNNRPIFNFDNDGLLRVFGKPVYVAGTASGMPSVSTGSKPVVLFGDYESAFSAVQRSLQTRVLVERFMDQLQVGFVSSLRVGSAAGISGAVKALVTAAS